MTHVAPEGGIYQAGTLSGNPLAMAAGIATLKLLREADYPALESRVSQFAQQLEAILLAKGVDAQVPHYASMFSVFFTNKSVRNFEDVTKCDTRQFTRFYKGMRKQGVYLAPSAFETAMVSFAHTEADFEQALEATARVRL
jgi:glutamate-1-semialdehyde 2,1-aminomutase